MKPRKQWKPGEYVYHRFGYAARILAPVDVPGYESAGPWYKVIVLTGRLKGDTRTVTWRDLAASPGAERWENPTRGQVRRARRWLRRLRGRAYRYAYALQQGQNPPDKLSPALASKIAAALEAARGGSAGGAGGAVAVFAGYQERLRGAPLELWNLLIDLPGHPRGSTVARSTVEAAGHQLPPAPVCTCPDLPAGGYAGSFGHYAGPGEPCPLAPTGSSRPGGPRPAKRRNPAPDWLVPSEIEDEPDAEPQEGDYTITGTRRGGEGVAEVGGRFLGEFRDVDAALAFIVQRMDAEQFFPNVWTVSDHGNLRLVEADELPKLKKVKGRAFVAAAPRGGSRNPPTTATTEGRILDLLAQAVQRELAGDAGGASWVWHRSMSPQEHLAFDLFLVRTRDPLAYVAGTAESRFRARVQRMAQLERHRRAGTVPENPCHRPGSRSRSRSNPNRSRGRSVPSNAVKIYDSYAFDPGTVGRGRHVGGGRYYHKHSSKTRMQTFGLPDGSLVLKPHRGRLWGYR